MEVADIAATMNAFAALNVGTTSYDGAAYDQQVS